MLKYHFKDCINFKPSDDYATPPIDEDNNIEVNEDAHTDVRKSHLFDFIDIPSYITVLSPNSAHELFYLCKVIKKDIAADNIEDVYGHKIFKGEQYLVGNYLEKVDEKRSDIVYKLLANHAVYIHVYEVNQTFVDFNPSTMSIPKEEYLSLIGNY